ncbi:MAG TPA: cytochrome [Halomicronema sp.]
MRKTIIGIMGPGAGATETDLQNAEELGELISQQNWFLLTGGRNCGVMEAASQGAKKANGFVIGIMPTNDNNSISEAVDIAIFTDMGNARNNINILSSDVVVACGMGAGTASEVALALKANKNVILLNTWEESKIFFQSLSKDHVFLATSPQDAIHLIHKIIKNESF